MDIYTDHRVSINAAVWARSRPHNELSRRLRLHLQSIAKARAERDALDAQIDALEELVKGVTGAIEEIQKGQ